MSGDLQVKRAETIFLWYKQQRNHATQLTDAEIAIRLNGIAPGEGWCRPNGTANADVVRAVRRWTDKQDDGFFADIRYGTRENGGGRNGWSHLHDGKPAQAMATMLGSVGQLDAVDQRMRAEMERRARESLKLAAQSLEWNKQGDFAKAYALHDAADDVEQYGYITPKTRARLAAAGLRAP